MMKTIVITPPINELVTLSEAKAQLRIEDGFTLDDDYISALISAARDRCEHYCNRFFTAKDIKITFTGSVSGAYSIPYPDLNVTSVTYIDESNTEQTAPPSSYYYDDNRQMITFNTTFNSSSFSVYATTSAPAELDGVKMAIKMIVTDLYELRTETAVGVSLADNPAVKAMLYPYRLELGI